MLQHWKMWGVIAGEFRTVRAPLEDVSEWARENTRLRPGFVELARERRPLVVSSGFHELIEPILAREGVEVEVVANRVEPRPDGWIVDWRRGSPKLVGVCIFKLSTTPTGVKNCEPSRTDRLSPEAKAPVMA